MERVPVGLGSRSYDVLIGAGLVERAHAHLAPLARDGRLIAVSEERVWAAQGERLVRGLAPIEAVPLLVPPGEGSKSWPVLIDLVERLLALGVERGDHILAFGGGVIGDLAGFAAAILKRGCRFVQVPTSLLAQVDSSVGGKTGINAASGKNLVGAFHQPSSVLIDPECLETLDLRHLRAGYAEIVKYALIADAAFFAWLEANGAALLAGDAEARRHAIAAAVRGKAAIVAADERETHGRRLLLNLGHTFGHALEAEAGFSDRLLHGEAVAAGIVLAFDFSAARGICPPQDAARVRAHLAAAGLPVSVAAEPARLVAHMRGDKKIERGRLPFILARGIGKAYVERGVGLAEVEAFLDGIAE
ncbi:MAG: 3-dehydroquinate synthase [Sphingomonadales bacterium]|jgi:3-dehydroquinate synthase|nr:3-dehydroquinate synthase [Sphingomonadales bacterium]